MYAHNVFTNYCDTLVADTRVVVMVKIELPMWLIIIKFKVLYSVEQVKD